MTLLLSLAAGVFSWTFAEYAIHNWVGHKTRGRTEFSREHLAHHRDTRYFSPNAKKVTAAVPVIVPMGIVSVFAAGWVHGLAFTLAFAATYVAYEVLHRRTHTHAPVGPHARWARRHHLHHHYRNANSNHGVTSPLWDWVFGTLEPCGQVKIPRSKAPSWMVDGEREIRAPYREDYVLVGPRARIEVAAK
ncbi:MAG: sterol desaturase family protein [Deltaproteobacteria bacterium]|nr:sterol desaturase family protein [Deltaproteobacteria bacterium]